MYPGKRNKPPESAEEQAQDSLLIDDDWAGLGPAERVRVRPKDDSELELTDDIMTML